MDGRHAVAVGVAPCPLPKMHRYAENHSDFPWPERIAAASGQTTTDAARTHHDRHRVAWRCRRQDAPRNAAGRPRLAAVTEVGVSRTGSGKPRPHTGDTNTMRLWDVAVHQADRRPSRSSRPLTTSAHIQLGRADTGRLRQPVRGRPSGGVQFPHLGCHHRRHLDTYPCPGDVGPSVADRRQ